jgi:hypothetical protein
VILYSKRRFLIWCGCVRYFRNHDMFVPVSGCWVTTSDADAFFMSDVKAFSVGGHELIKGGKNLID